MFGDGAHAQDWALVVSQDNLTIFALAPEVHNCRAA